MATLHNSINGVEVGGQFTFTHLGLCWCQNQEPDRNGNHRVIISNP